MLEDWEPCLAHKLQHSNRMKDWWILVDQLVDM